jgi:hypothetical protein
MEIRWFVKLAEAWNMVLSRGLRPAIGPDGLWCTERTGRRYSAQGVHARRILPLIVLALLVASCGTSPALKPTSGGAPQESKTVGADGGTLSSGGVSVIVPPGALSRATNITLSSQLTRTGIEESKYVAQISPSVRLDFAEPLPLARPIQIQFAIDPSRLSSLPPPPTSGFAAIEGDSASSTYAIVPATYDANAHTVSVMSSKVGVILSAVVLSSSVLLQGIVDAVSKVLGTRAIRPSCSNSPLLLTDGREVSLTSTSRTGADPELFTCLDKAGGSEGRVTATIVNNRPFSYAFRMPVGVHAEPYLQTFDDSTIKLLYDAGNIGQTTDAAIIGGTATEKLQVSTKNMPVALQLYPDPGLFFAAGAQLALFDALPIVLGDQNAQDLVRVRNLLESAGNLQCLSGLAQFGIRWCPDRSPGCGEIRPDCRPRLCRHSTGGGQEGSDFCGPGKSYRRGNHTPQGRHSDLQRI